MHPPIQQKACGIENSPKKLNASIICVLPWLMVACGMVLMPIWPIMHTVAFRNLLLFAGGLIGFWYIFQERRNLYQKPALPLLFVSLLIIWVGIHYLFFTRNSGLELEGIAGTWMRVLLACFLGVGTGLFARNRNRARPVIWAGIFSFLIVFYFDYVWVSYASHNWGIPYRFETGVFGNKISAVFYGLILLALACAVISYQLIQTGKPDRRILFASVILIGLTFLAFIITGTKNGVVLGLVLIFSLIGLFAIRAKLSSRSILIASTFTILIGLMSYWHLKLNPEWNNFSSSVAAGLQVNEYSNWEGKRIENGLVMLADGNVVGESAYMRTAFFIVGLKRLLENPLGYGLIDKSFKYLVEEDEVVAHKFNLVATHSDWFGLVATHSGWLDFSLGLGVPGILLVWGAIASAIFYSYKQKTLWSYGTRWILAGVFLAWIFAEICSSHFVETLFYLITLLSAGNLRSLENNLTTRPK